MMERRAFLQAALMTFAVSAPLSQVQAMERQMEEVIAAFCMIRQIEAQQGQRAALIANFETIRPLVGHVGGFTIFEDAADDNSLWILDFWRSREDYDAALQKAELSAMLAEQRLLIAKIKSSALLKIPTPMES